MSSTQLIFVRHGASRSTEVHVVAGHFGCRGLSVEGVAQSESLARRWLMSPPYDVSLPFGGAYCSLMRRSKETATIVLSSLGLELSSSLCDLCEIHPGQADGLSWEEFTEKFGDPDIYGNSNVPIAPGGESWVQVKERVMGSLAAIVEKHPGQSVLLFTHKGVIDAALEAWLGVDPSKLVNGSRNTGITTWMVNKDEYRNLVPVLISYNDAGHLELLN